MTRRLLALGLLVLLGSSAALAAWPAPGPQERLAPRLADAWHVQPAPLDAPPSLRDAVQAWDARLGVQRAPGALGVLDALDPALAQPAVRLLGALGQAQAMRDQAFAGIGDAELWHAALHPSDPASLRTAQRADAALVRQAEVTVAQAVDEALPALQAYRASLSLDLRVAGPPLVDLAPVLVLDPLLGDTLYAKDAVLILDIGGNDVYDNNAGGSIIAQGPIDTDPGTCQYDLGGLAVGCEMQDANFAFTAALSLDLTGNDVYGVAKAPRGRDTRCTTEPIVRRIVIQGAGTGGAGMLVDVTGDDVYNGKTLAQSNGHVAGAGALFDLAGNDVYNVMREGPGSADLGGAGYFLDAQGGDQYIHRSPAGGIHNADSGRCDATERFGLGAAILAGVAGFTDLAGADTYRIASQAFGSVDSSSAAAFLDAGGVDDYGGYPGVGNGVTSPRGAALFVDA
ncbi:MAG: hypothetical protein LC624_03175 [Halobacteriales archaeon]|nr:hypothetical protein [Halobacteriales archaeon]